MQKGQYFMERIEARLFQQTRSLRHGRETIVGTVGKSGGLDVMTGQVEPDANVSLPGITVMSVNRLVFQLAFAAGLSYVLFVAATARAAEATAAAKAIVSAPVAVSRVQAPAAAAEVDRLLHDEVLQKAKSSVATPVDDLTYLHRISLDIAGRLPTPGEITAFSLDPSTNKRPHAVEGLLTEDGYAENWARYSAQCDHVSSQRRPSAVGDAAA